MIPSFRSSNSSVVRRWELRVIMLQGRKGIVRRCPKVFRFRLSSMFHTGFLVLPIPMGGLWGSESRVGAREGGSEGRVGAREGGIEVEEIETGRSRPVLPVVKKAEVVVVLAVVLQRVIIEVGGDTLVEVGLLQTRW